MHSDNEDADFFSKTEYKSKKDIVNAVCQYHKNCLRAFKVVSSDHRRWELERNFFIGIVTDTAANMNSLGREIEEQWNTKYAVPIIFYSLLLF